MFAIAALFLIAVSILLYLFVFKKEKPVFDASLTEKAAQQLDTYRLDMIFDPEAGTILLEQRLVYENRTQDLQQDIVMRTWAGAFENASYSPAAVDEIVDITYGTEFSEGGIEIRRVWVEGEIADAVWEDAAHTVMRIRCGSISPGQKTEIRLKALITVPECVYRFGRQEDLWLLSEIVPTLSVWEDGAWRTEEYWPVGTPFYSGFANYEVVLRVPEGYAVLSSVPLSLRDGAYQGTLLCARDVAFVIGRGMVLKTEEYGGVRLQSMARTEKSADDTLSCMKKALGCYTGLYGAYPYETLSAAECRLPVEGSSSPALMLLDGERYKNETRLEKAVAFECAKQWFCFMVGCDPWYQPWQGSGIARYAVLRYWEKYHGSDAMEDLRKLWLEEAMRTNIVADITPGSPLDYFGNLTDYAIVVYDRGAAFIAACNDFCNNKMDAFLHHYVEAYRFRMVTREDFRSLFSLSFGLDPTPLMEDFLDTLH